MINTYFETRQVCMHMVINFYEGFPEITENHCEFYKLLAYNVVLPSQTTDVVW